MSCVRIVAGLSLSLFVGLAMAQILVSDRPTVVGKSLIDTHHAPPPMPPGSPRHDVTVNYFGAVVHDPYRWLEDGDAPAVKRWISAQNAYTEKVMDGFADAKEIARRVGELALTSTERYAPEIVGKTLFYLRQTPPQPQALLVAQAWPQGKASVLVDPNDKHGSEAITDYWPSPDGRVVAYGTASGGNEATTIHFVEVAKGKRLLDALPRAGGGTTPPALVWDADSKGVTYVRLPLHDGVPGDQLQFEAALYHHKLGTAGKSDTIAFGKGLSRVAEYTLLESTNGQHAAALLHYGDGAPDSVYIRNGMGPWKQVLDTDSEVRAASGVNEGAAWDGDRLLVIAYQDAPRGKLLSVDREGHSKLFVAQGVWAMHSVAPIKDGFLITEVRGPDWRVQHYDASGKFLRTVGLPSSGIGVGSIASSADSPQALIDYSGWRIPSRWVAYGAAHGKLKTVFEVKPAADYSKLVTYRLDATSKDGTKVPVTVIAMQGITPNGKRPTILYGYGGYGIATAPRFLGPSLTWLERGGVYAVANIRGGGEYGEGWHANGMLGHKQNGFDDFYASAQALVAHHWTAPAYLGILGGSNGGLLMGASLTQHPSEYAAVVSLVGMYDMLRVEDTPNGQYNVSEYGTVTNKADFEWLRAYSPLHNIERGTAYPAVLLITGINDPRVAPWQSRKFAAALQTATTSHKPVLLLTRMHEGHGVTASFSQRVGNTAAALGFFSQELGLGTTTREPAK